MAMHKCENCGKEVKWKSRKERGQRAVGWVGTMRSKYGNQYDRGSCAWWCPSPECRENKLLTELEKLFPHASQTIIEAMKDDIELQRLRAN